MRPSHGFTSPLELHRMKRTNFVTFLIRAAVSFFFWKAYDNTINSRSCVLIMIFRTVPHFQTELHCAAAMRVNVTVTRDPSSKQTILWCTSSVKTHRTMRHCRCIPRLRYNAIFRSTNTYRKTKQKLHSRLFKKAVTSVNNLLPK